MSAPKYVESIPAVSGPVKLPRLTPPRFDAWEVAGGVLAVLVSALFVLGLTVTS